MKIAYLINQYPKVSHTFIRREIDALRALGAVVQAVSMRGWSDTLADPADEVERSRTLYVLRRGSLGLLVGVMHGLLRWPVATTSALLLSLSMWRQSSKSLLLHIVYWAEACVVAREAVRHGCVHLHAHFGTNPADVAMLASLVSGTPFSFTVHGPEEFDAPRSLGLREKIRRCAFVAAVSSFGRSQLYRHADLGDWHKIKVVHCGLDRLFLDAEPPAMISGGRLVCVGRLCEQKGQIVLLRAIRRVLDAGHACSLILAGDGELRGEILREITALSLESTVAITGWISSSAVRDEILAARGLVLPSFAEGLPVVLMEAMALGKPVLTTYVAGIPELVEHGRSGWLVPAGDVDALAAALVELLTTESSRLQAMGREGQRRVRALHNAQIEAGKLLCHFQESAVAPDR
jgi:glycosyltransferase involved in cell wall biosynthesis